MKKSTRYKGVVKKRRNGRWIFMISFQHNNVIYQFGSYDDEKECAKAYDMFVIKKQLKRETNFFKKKLV